MDGRGREPFDLPLDLSGLSAWDRAVLDGVRRIPWGRTESYGGVARMIGRPGAARAVGGAVGRNPIGVIIPAIASLPATARSAATAATHGAAIGSGRN